ncbi:hypothetical protein [Embleya sp. NBC_00896]|uniref:hypothetical protein n=1 Tax=Embleya sp. NBC_00896 TaxID=2975961 RepID=UPI003865E65A|nr:hypothetical protein OG928_31785 [Embleya sp. NBC_00896]
MMVDPEAAAAAWANSQVPLGVSHREPFYEDLVNAGSVAEVEGLMRKELRRASGHDVDLDLTGGDLYTMKEVALASVHWARLHRDVPFHRLSLADIPPEKKGEEPLADADAGEIRLNVKYFGAGKRPELLNALVQSKKFKHLLTGDKFGAVPVILHELEHLREIAVGEGFLPDLLKTDRDFTKKAERERAASSQRQLPAYTKSAEAFFKERPALRLVNDQTTAQHVGKYATRNKYELFAESGARVHIFGRGADWVSLEVTQAVGPVDTIVAAAPRLRLAVADLHSRLDRKNGLAAGHATSLLQPFAQPTPKQSVGVESPRPASAGPNSGPPGVRGLTSLTDVVTAMGSATTRRATSPQARAPARSLESGRGRPDFTPPGRRSDRESGQSR